MGQGRRDFLRLISLAPPTVTAASALVRHNGGDVNIHWRARPPVYVANKDQFFGQLKSSMVDVRDHGLYDSIRLQADMDVPKWIPLFCNPVGHNRPGTWEFKTAADTNSWCANRLPPPTSQKIERIITLVSPGADEQDLEQFCMNYYWELQLMQKIVGRAPVAHAPVFGSIADLFEDGKRKGKVVPEICVNLQQPVMIESMMHYGFDLRGTPFHTRKPLDVFFVLDGLGVFGVQ